ncbi:MAG TPA: hypothetical protein VEA16_11510, partial [Vicinamibacterales bacterium]|nr:hypothetical protein [Vicinamibacterales bacterium]
MGIARTLVRSAAATTFLLASSQAGAQLLTLSNLPLYVGANVQPLVMLSLSKDQQLYKKAYNDYSDLDNDGELEATYKHSINYYGYFDPYKCYTYSSANKRFEPAADTSGLAAANQKYCDTVAGDWSGNFLNWASMSRMDAVRKLLYGGLRSPNRTNGDGNPLSDGDTATGTVLERAYLPTDAHSWVKFYDGTDIARLTPVTPDNFTTTSTTSTNIGTGSKTFTLASGTNFVVGDIVEIARSSNPTTHFLRATVTAKPSSTQITVNASAINLSSP